MCAGHCGEIVSVCEMVSNGESKSSHKRYHYCEKFNVTIIQCLFLLFFLHIYEVF